MRLRTAVILTSLIALVSGCSSWSAIKPPPSAMPASAPLPGRVQVILLDQRQLVVHQPRIFGDSRRGLRDVPPAKKSGLFFNPTSQESCSIALADTLGSRSTSWTAGRSWLRASSSGGSRP